MNRRQFIKGLSLLGLLPFLPKWFDKKPKGAIPLDEYRKQLGISKFSISAGYPENLTVQLPDRCIRAYEPLLEAKGFNLPTVEKGSFVEVTCNGKILAGGYVEESNSGYLRVVRPFTNITMHLRRFYNSLP